VDIDFDALTVCVARTATSVPKVTTVPGQWNPAMHWGPAIRDTRGLTKHYGRRPALVDLDLDVPPGSARPA